MEYRLGVVGVFQNRRGEVLVCERSNRPGAWQFPQGGIDAGETPDVAIVREVREELGCEEFEIVRSADTWTTYEFPPEADFPVARAFRGQKHKWYLLRFKGDAEPNLAMSDGEFKDWRWVMAGDSCQHVIGWKKDAYLQGVKLLGLV